MEAGCINIRLAERVLEVQLAMTSVEEVGAGLDAIKAAARALFPDIVFIGEPGFEDEPAEVASSAPAADVAEPAAPTSSPESFEKRVVSAAPKTRKPMTFTPPIEGSTSHKMLKMILAAGKVDVAALADQFNLSTPIAASLVARLRRAGCLDAIAA